MSSIKLPKTIKMIITDFDGVVTDNCVYINDNYTVSRRLNFKDIMGFYILKKNGYNIAIISGEKNSAIEILSKKLDIKEIHQQIRNKIDILQMVIKKYQLTQEDYVYIGDDINDLECLEFAKYKITVPNAVKKIKLVEGIQVTESLAGEGAFREVAECIVG